MKRDCTSDINLDNNSRFVCEDTGSWSWLNCSLFNDISDEKLDCVSKEKYMGKRLTKVLDNIGCQISTERRCKVWINPSKGKPKPSTKKKPVDNSVPLSYSDLQPTPLKDDIVSGSPDVLSLPVATEDGQWKTIYRKEESRSGDLGTTERKIIEEQVLNESETSSSSKSSEIYENKKPRTRKRRNLSSTIKSLVKHEEPSYYKKTGKSSYEPDIDSKLRSPRKGADKHSYYTYIKPIKKSKNLYDEVSKISAPPTNHEKRKRKDKHDDEIYTYVDTKTVSKKPVPGRDDVEIVTKREIFEDEHNTKDGASHHPESLVTSEPPTADQYYTGRQPVYQEYLPKNSLYTPKKYTQYPEYTQYDIQYDYDERGNVQQGSGSPKVPETEKSEKVEISEYADKDGEHSEVHRETSFYERKPKTEVKNTYEEDFVEDSVPLRTNELPERSYRDRYPEPGATQKEPISDYPDIEYEDPQVDYPVYSNGTSARTGNGYSSRRYKNGTARPDTVISPTGKLPIDPKYHTYVNVDANGYPVNGTLRTSTKQEASPGTSLQHGNGSPKVPETEKTEKVEITEHADKDGTRSEVHRETSFYERKPKTETKNKYEEDFVKNFVPLRTSELPERSYRDSYPEPGATQKTHISDYQDVEYENSQMDHPVYSNGTSARTGNGYSSRRYENGTPRADTLGSPKGNQLKHTYVNVNGNGHPINGTLRTPTKQEVSLGASQRRAMHAGRTPFHADQKNIYDEVPSSKNVELEESFRKRIKNSPLIKKTEPTRRKIPYTAKRRFSPKLDTIQENYKNFTGQPQSLPPVIYEDGKPNGGNGTRFSRVRRHFKEETKQLTSDDDTDPRPKGWKDTKKTIPSFMVPKATRPKHGAGAGIKPASRFGPEVHLREKFKRQK
ncbi:hypothetical protein CHUAL_007745 [Chamberlinius hualienensis]